MTKRYQIADTEAELHNILLHNTHLHSVRRGKTLPARHNKRHSTKPNKACIVCMLSIGAYVVSCHTAISPLDAR